MVVYYLLTSLFVLTCFLLLLVILLQQGKGDMAAAFGGGSSQSAFGARGGATVLSKATAVLAGLFMIIALALAIIGQRGPGSIVSGAAPSPPAPVRQQIPATPPANTTTPPKTPPPTPQPK